MQISPITQFKAQIVQNNNRNSNNQPLFKGDLIFKSAAYENYLRRGFDSYFDRKELAMHNLASAVFSNAENAKYEAFHSNGSGILRINQTNMPETRIKLGFEDKNIIEEITTCLKKLRRGSSSETIFIDDTLWRNPN